MSDTTPDAGKMTKDELSRWLELHLFGNNLTVNVDSHNSLAAALQDKISEYNCGTGISVNIRDPDTGAWGTGSVIPFFDAEIPGMFSFVYVYKMRHGQPWQSAIEQHVRDHRFPPRDLATPTGQDLVTVAMWEKGYWLRIKGDPDRNTIYVNFEKPLRDLPVFEAAHPSQIPECAARAAVAALTESEAENG